MDEKNIVIAKSRVCGNSILLRNVIIKKFCAWCSKEHDFVIKDVEVVRQPHPETQGVLSEPSLNKSLYTLSKISNPRE